MNRKYEGLLPGAHGIEYASDANEKQEGIRLKLSYLEQEDL